MENSVKGAEERKKPLYMNCEGVIVPAVLSQEAVRSAIHYSHRPGDLFITTYPKCGTTWMQHIVMLILQDGKPINDPLEFFLRTPSIEMCGADAIDLMPGPGVIKTHLPMEKMKMNPKAKYIFVARNPRDCCVSLYHHTKNLLFYKFEDGTFDEFFELFIEGNVDYGDYFDHLLPWYNRRHDDNIYFTTFERIKKNTKEEVLNIAAFIDEKHREKLENNPKLFDDILYYSSLDYMKTHSKYKCFVQKLSDHIKQGKPISSGLKAFYKNLHDESGNKSMKGEFIRKGTIGDWKNHFTPEQERIFQEKVKMKTRNSDVMDLWKE
ncbi:sulfotransferase ssu-1-like [Centruroides vittatus]|uniref:sulfotransferase ssu-1-like n=1 Tax=Centruroides vittatus TaxID=120091 RepID=UPI00350F9723